MAPSVYKFNIAGDFADVGDEREQDFKLLTKVRGFGGWLSLRHQVTGTKIPVATIDSVRVDDGDTRYKWYTTRKNGIEILEHEIIYKDRPKMPRVMMDFDSSGIIAAYQKPLNQEIKPEKDGKANKKRKITVVTENEAKDEKGFVWAYRPPEKVGSLAVYRAGMAPIHRSAADGERFKTWKVCHIDCPVITDANGNKSRCNMTLKNGLLVIEIDPTFLKAGKPPFTLDPTFGYESIGGSTQTMGGDTILGDHWTTPAGAITGTNWVCHGYYKMHNGDATGNFKGVIYNNGSPFAKVTNGSGAASTQITDTAGWKTSAFATAPSVQDATQYHFGAIIGNESEGVFDYYYDADVGIGMSFYQGTFSYASPPSNLNDATDVGDYVESIYWTFDSGGGSTPKPKSSNSSKLLAGGML